MHRYIIGQTRTGKTSLMRELISFDSNPTIIYFDTAGTVPFTHDLLIDPTVTRWNPLAEPIDKDLAPNFFADTVKDAYRYDDLTTPVMSMYLAFTAAALIENRYNLTDAPRFLIDAAFRDKCSYQTELVQQFWDAFETLTDKDKRYETASTLNKFLTLLLDGRIHRMLSVNKKTFSLADCEGKTTLVRLPIAAYGKSTVSLVGSLLLAYLLRTTHNASIYLEDAHLFAPGVLKDILSASTVSLTLSHQYISQLDRSVFDAIQGNCAQQFIFRVSPQDADVLSRDLPPMSSKCGLDELAHFSYRTLPYDKSPDGVTVPLEM